MIAAVIATANHFVLAVIAGMALTILAYLLVPLLSLPRRPDAHLGSGSATSQPSGSRLRFGCKT